MRLQDTQTIIHQHGPMVADISSEISPSAAAIFFSAVNLRVVCPMGHHMLGVWTRSIDETMCSLSQFPSTTWESR